MIELGGVISGLICLGGSTLGHRNQVENELGYCIVGGGVCGKSGCEGEISI